MSGSMWSNICVATVATERFVPGTKVMFRSFLDAHPDFSGELALIHSGLPEKTQSELRSLFPGLRFVEAHPDLAQRIAGLTARLPQLAITNARFLSLEALRIAPGKRVLFLDSDLLFLQPIDNCLSQESDILAVGDGCNLRGHARSRETMAEIAPGPWRLNRTFNAGLMLLGPNVGSGKDYDAALHELNFDRFSRQKAGLHDQAIFNLVFDGRQQLIDWRYNYLIRQHNLIQANKRIAPREIRVLHFNQSRKPWEVDEVDISLASDPFITWCHKRWQEHSLLAEG